MCIAVSIMYKQNPYKAGNYGERKRELRKNCANLAVLM